MGGRGGRACLGSANYGAWWLVSCSSSTLTYAQCCPSAELESNPVLDRPTDMALGQLKRPPGRWPKSRANVVLLLVGGMCSAGDRPDTVAISGQNIFLGQQRGQKQLFS